MRLIGTIRYAAIERLPVILGQYDQLPSRSAKTDQHTEHSVQSQYHQTHSTRTMPVDLAGKVNGMYRLLNVIGESGSDGHGM